MTRPGTITRAQERDYEEMAARTFCPKEEETHRFFHAYSNMAYYRRELREQVDTTMRRLRRMAEEAEEQARYSGRHEALARQVEGIQHALAWGTANIDSDHLTRYLADYERTRARWTTMQELNPAAARRALALAAECGELDEEDR